ncbi:MAG: hypothetical protein AB3N11_07700 [Arenibacterium sp.]
MEDDFETHAVGLTAPAQNAEVIIPSDTNELAFATRAIYVGVGGSISIVLLSGDTAILNNVQAGVLYPIRARQVMATGTTATSIIGLR